MLRVRIMENIEGWIKNLGGYKFIVSLPLE